MTQLPPLQPIAPRQPEPRIYFLKNPAMVIRVFEVF